jgi:ABC-type branched-subunit amino acid transport system substrate-binding protein
VSKKILIILSVVLLVVGGLFAACGGEAEVEKDEIVFGGSRPLTGANAIYEQTAFGPIRQMWVEDVNAAGGIYVEEYGKNLTLAEPIIYDDTSDLSTMTRQLELLMTVDKVDFCFPPASTACLFAAAPIFNKYEYILMGAEGGATSIEQLIGGLPYFFGVLNYSDRYQLPVFADLCVELGIEKVAMIWLQDLHGIEYSGVAATEFDNQDIEVVMSKSVPIDVSDVSLLLLEAQDAGAEALCCFAYPDQNFLIVGTAVAMGINFNAILLGPGGCFTVFPYVVFSPEIAEGVMFEGAWNCSSTPGAAAFCDEFIAKFGEVTVDWWGHLPYQAGVEFLQQAIVAAGTLDQPTIRDVMATSTFDTVLGPTWFDMFGDGGGLLAIECYAGQIGQWQNGTAEVIDPPNQYGNKRTADPVYPKPDWPTAE